MNALFRTVNKEEATAIQKRKQRFNTQEPQRTSSTTGRKLHLPQDLYKDVVTSASRFKGQPGFGVRLIKAAATFTYNKAYKHLLDNANWVPSDSWCYWFLHNVEVPAAFCGVSHPLTRGWLNGRIHCTRGVVALDFPTEMGRGGHAWPG